MYFSDIIHCHAECFYITVTVQTLMLLVSIITFPCFEVYELHVMKLCHCALSWFSGFIWLIWPISSFGRTNGAPLRWRWQDGGSSASGRHLGWPHFRFPWGHFLGSRKWPHGKRKWGHPRWRPEAELPPSCHLHLNGAPFVLPMSWMTSVGRLHRSLNVLQTSASHETSRADHRESKFFQRHTEIPYDDVWLFFWLLGSIWSLASPSHSWNDWGSCPLATTRKSISLHMSTPRLMENSYPWGMVLALASTYFFFFFFF